MSTPEPGAVRNEMLLVGPDVVLLSSKRWYTAFHTITAPDSAAVIAAATPLRSVTADRLMPVTLVAAPPFFVYVNPPDATAVKLDSVCCASDSGEPRKMPLVAVLAQRPIFSAVGCGDWPNHSNAALYSGALLPKSAATASMPV